MTVENRRAKWLDALRSGSYRQGKSSLHSTLGTVRSFCCLGVACDVIKDELKGNWIVENNTDVVFKCPSPVGDYTCRLFTSLDPAVMDMLGLNQTIEAELIDLNDRYDCDFDTIARAIEAFATLPDREVP